MPGTLAVAGHKTQASSIIWAVHDDDDDDDAGVIQDLGNSLANKDLAAREATLDKRERALAAKEEELKQMEKVPRARPMS